MVKLGFSRMCYLKRNCSTEKALIQHCREYKQYLKNQKYPSKKVEDQFSKALALDRSELLKSKPKTRIKVFPLVLDYNPKPPNVSAILEKHSKILANSTELIEHFASSLIFPACRRTKNLKDILPPSKF